VFVGLSGVVQHINQEVAYQLDTRAIHERWNRLFKGNILSARYLRQELLCDAELAVISSLLCENLLS
jgi:hypothetical protein